MNDNRLGKLTRSFGVSFAVTSILSALLVIMKESNEETVLEWMKSATGHHWVTHGVLDIILFIVLGWLFSKMNSGNGVDISDNGLVFVIVGSIVLSWLMIAGFYL